MDAFSLADTYLLRGLAMGDIESIQNVSELKEFEDGQTIVAEGSEGQDIMVVVGGRARVTTMDGKTIGELRKGEMIGEISFLDGRSRTATVVALGEAKILVIPAGRLRDLMKANPSLELIVLRNATKALCQRIRDANTQIESLLVLR